MSEFETAWLVCAWCVQAMLLCPGSRPIYAYTLHENLPWMWCTAMMVASALLDPISDWFLNAYTV